VRSGDDPATPLRRELWELRGPDEFSGAPGEAPLVLAVVLHLPLLLSATWAHEGVPTRFEQVRPRGGRILASQIVRESRVRYS